MIKSSALVAILASLLLHSAAVAQQAPLRIGLVYCFSGPFAVAGAQVDAAINLFMKRHGDVVAGRKVEIVRRDIKFPHVFINQLIQVILRNVLDDCDDVFILRAAEMFFRPQKLMIHEDSSRSRFAALRT